MNGALGLFLSLALLLGQFSIPIPSLPVPPLPIPGKLPQLPSEIPIPPLLRDTPPLASSFADAKNAAPFLDGVSPHTYASLLWAPRNAGGDFVVQPGAYELVSQSFCLNAGAHGPGGSETYLGAPLTGSRADIIHTVLARAADHPEIGQHAIQLLLWGITSRAKIADASDDVRRAATVLLSQHDIDTLNGGALGRIPDVVKQKFVASLPASARELFAAQEQVRDVLTHGNASYEEIARIAAPPPGPKAAGSVPGRWSLMPAGYYVRAVPSSYSTARIQVLAPGRVNVSRDGRGRIVSFGTGERESVTIAYDDRTAALAAGGAKAYAIGAVRIRHRVLLPPLAIQRDRNVAARGWTLVGAPGASTAAPAAFPGFAARAQTAARRARGGASGDALDLLSLADALGALPVTDRVWTEELRGTVVDLAASGAAYAACAQRGPCGRQAVLASANTVRSDVAQVPQILIGGAVVLLFGLVFVSDSPTQPLGASGRPSASGTPSGVPPPAGSAPGGTGPGPNGPPKPSDYPPADKARDCAAVASAMQTDRYIQSLYADPGLLAKAAAQHWSGSQYDGQIKFEVLTRAASPSGQPLGAIDGVSPGGTTASITCTSTIGTGAGVSLDEWAKGGYPKIVYESVQVHEKVHADLCNARPVHDRYVPATPEEVSAEEIKAYQAAIDFLQQWANQYCGS